MLRQCDMGQISATHAPRCISRLNKPRSDHRLDGSNKFMFKITEVGLAACLRLPAWHLPRGPVSPPARWADTSNVEVGQMKSIVGHFISRLYKGLRLKSYLNC